MQAELDDLRAHQSALKLDVTEEESEMGDAERMLLYLDAQTWSSADSDRLATHVAKAKERGMHVLLAHEMPEHPAIRPSDGPRLHGCEFSNFFSST